MHSPTTPLSAKQRDDRGLQNDITGRLLCPIKFSWDDDECAMPYPCQSTYCCSLVVFVARFEIQKLIFRRIILSLAFIPMDEEIQMMWNTASFVVAFQLRYATFPPSINYQATY